MTNLQAAEKYVLDGIGGKDLSKVPLHEQVRFKGPLNEETLVGKGALQTFLEGIYPVVGQVRVRNSIANGNTVCVEWELDLTEPRTTIPILEYFEVKDGKLFDIRPYYDPRPIAG